MSVRGKVSDAHEFNSTEDRNRIFCIHCKREKFVIDQMSLECTGQRELIVDTQKAEELNQDLWAYRRGEPVAVRAEVKVG